MGARRSGGRRGDSRWELAPGEAGLRVVAVKLHQQYETPPAVMDFVRRTWRPTFDAMATPFSAIAPAYATLEDDVLRADAVPRGSVVYVNPAYAPLSDSLVAFRRALFIRRRVTCAEPPIYTCEMCNQKWRAVTSSKPSQSCPSCENTRFDHGATRT